MMHMLGIVRSWVTHQHTVVGKYLRSGGGDLLPGFGDVLFQLIERCDAQLPLNVRQLLLLGCQHLGQSQDLILNLHTHHTHVEVLNVHVACLTVVLS